MSPKAGIANLSLNISYLTFCFLFIFGPVFNKFGSWFDVIFILSIFIFVYYFRKFKHILISPLIQFFILIVFYSALSIKILFYPNLTFLQWLINFLKPFRILFTLFSGYFILSFFCKNGFSFFDLVSTVFAVIILHSFIIITQFFVIEFRDFIYSYTTTGEFRSTFEYDFRMGGLTGGSGGAVLSTVQSLGVILLPFLLKLNNSRLTRFLSIIGSFLIIISIILTGRSGIYCIIIFLPISIYLVNGSLKTFRYTIYIFTFSVISFLFINQLLLSLELVDFYNSFYRTFDSFISLTETGKYENETVLILKDYILFPDLQTLFFGSNDALLNFDVDRNLDSDIGYVRNIFSFGLVGFFIYIFPFLNLLLFAIKKIRSSLPHKLLFILLIIMAFFHSKESFLYVRMFWSIICLVIGFILAESSKYKSN